MKNNKLPLRAGVKIWIDLDNTPHVPFFIPIIHELELRGHSVVLTARDAFQVCELADKYGLQYKKIGHHYGKNPILKIMGMVWRSGQLFYFYLHQKPGLALSHGSRSEMLLGNLLRVPTVTAKDYEHVQTIPGGHPRWSIVPEALKTGEITKRTCRIRYFRGIKEDVYVPLFKPDSSISKELGIRPDEIIITVRPPASQAHYHNPQSDQLLNALMARVCETPGVRVVLLPRNHLQEQDLRKIHPNWFLNSKTIIPTKAVNALNLIWFSDLVVSGGGTMNREAAALGVPVYSIFCGRTGAVDRMLEQEGRLIMIRNIEDVRAKISFIRREKPEFPDNQPREALMDIIGHIEEIIKIERVRPFLQHT